MRFLPLVILDFNKIMITRSQATGIRAPDIHILTLTPDIHILTLKMENRFKFRDTVDRPESEQPPDPGKTRHFEDLFCIREELGSLTPRPAPRPSPRPSPRTPVILEFLDLRIPALITVDRTVKWMIAIFIPARHRVQFWYMRDIGCNSLCGT
jgi:hypothetical protein